MSPTKRAVSAGNPPRVAARSIKPAVQVDAQDEEKEKTQDDLHPKNKTAIYIASAIGGALGIVGILCAAYIARGGVKSTIETQRGIASDQYYQTLRQEHYTDLYNAIDALNTQNTLINTVDLRPNIKKNFDIWLEGFRRYDGLVAKGQLLSSPSVETASLNVEFAFAASLNALVKLADQDAPLFNTMKIASPEIYQDTSAIVTGTWLQAGRLAAARSALVNDGVPDSPPEYDNPDVAADALTHSISSFITEVRSELQSDSHTSDDSSSSTSQAPPTP